MDLMSFKNLYVPDPAYAPRTFDLQMFRRVLDGTLYDCLPYAFSQNSFMYTGEGGTQEEMPISISQRRPSVRCSLAKIVVDDAVSLLFGEENFPEILTDSQDTNNIIQSILSSTNLVKQMISSARDGSVGSACLFMKIINGKLYFENVLTEYLIPFYNYSDISQLVKIKQKYKVMGYELPFMGYDEKTIKVSQIYWIVREWTTTQEIVYKPFLTTGKQELIVDEERTITHNLGFVPAVWMKNLGDSNNGTIDGRCTFKDAIDTIITLDYIMSQGGRGLNYSLEPLLVIKDQAFSQNGEIVMGGGNILRLSEKGGAEHAEISGDATKAVIDYCDSLRKIILENIHGNRADPDKVSFAQSGKAMEILHLPLIWLASQMRISYGEDGLKKIINMVIDANKMYELIVDDEAIPAGALTCEGLQLKWSPWFPETTDDKQKTATTVRILKDANIISSKTATETVADQYNILDIEEELREIKLDRDSLIEENPKINEIIQG